jgi:ABC-type multidrug transport system fused ATPase/permease subunit
MDNINISMDNINQKKNYYSQLDFFTITKKYWKEQIIFYFLTALSCLLSFIVDHNVISNSWEKVSTGKWTPNFEIFGKVSISFRNLPCFMFFMAALTVIYCLAVLAHVYYAPYFANKISRDLRKKLMNKFFRLCDGTYDKKKALNIFNNDTECFVANVVFAPNQLFYLILTIIYAFSSVKISRNKAVWMAGSIYLLVIITIIFFFDKLLYQKDLNLQKVLENRTKKEDIAINKRDLIIKKGLVNNFSQDYKKTVNYVWEVANKREWIHTLSWVIPTYSLISYGGDLFLLPFIHKQGKSAYLTLKIFGKLFNAMKKMVERLKLYPYYFVAKKRLNDFLQLSERDDIQQNILISEPIENITLQKVNFAYEENKPVLKKLSLKFEKGKVNHLAGENGFGKSTIINLIMGLYHPQQGEIFVNNKYKISEINLIQWRKKIAYSEHENLIENGLSTGQKQLADLSNLFANSENKEVLIFDEADNSLDEKNKKEFREKLAELSSQKIVILVSH